MKKFSILSIFVIALMIGFSGAAQANLNAGLVAYYPFDGNAVDESGNNNHGTEHGGLTYSDGILGQASSFDGENDYIEVADSRSLQFDSDITISAWCKTTARTGTAQRIITKWSIGSRDSNTQEFVLSFDASYSSSNRGKVTFSYSGETVNAVEETGVDDAEWHHIVATSDGNKSSIYFDGILIDEGGFSLTAPNGTNPMYIGGGASSAPMPIYIWNGLIDDLRIYNRALSESEIQQLYTASGDPTIEPTTSITVTYPNSQTSWAIDQSLSADWVGAPGSQVTAYLYKGSTNLGVFTEQQPTMVI
ncbi:MAG: LamG domain-containing protein [Thermodesulfobacteriota bacterium]|nr:LamG domain-containing protein [Thermodesulfobacteriota bacterium]